MTSLTPDAYGTWLHARGAGRDPLSGMPGDVMLISGLAAAEDGGGTSETFFRSMPRIAVAVSGGDRNATEPWHDLVDVVVEPDDVDLLLGSISNAPIAATALALLLRSNAQCGIGDGLVAESATYSMLQASPEFRSWLAARPRRGSRPEDAPTVRSWRDDNVLHVRLSRPHVHNALNRQMRDELLSALDVAINDDTVRIELSGEGPSFCAGGDLDEFGSFSDVGSAHLVRLAASIGRVLAMLAPRVTARIHGFCVGSGIELPAFADRVVAAPSTRIRLPEVGFGLVPGAGGTVSLPRRIGRHRTAFLGLTGATIDTETAHRWGLVDTVDD